MLPAFLPPRLASLCASAAALALASGAIADDRLTLRAHDAIAEPGGLAAVVLRTYAPRPVGVGQVCLRSGAAGAAPFTALEGHAIFSGAGDVISSVELRQTAQGQEVLVQFESPSGSVNESDGPLAVLYLRLADSAQVGERYRIEVDPGNTVLFEPDGDAIAVRGRDGDLRVRAPGAPYRLEAEGDRVRPGETAELGVETYEPFPIASGRIVLRWPRQAAADRPTVRLDPRHGLTVASIHRSRRRVAVTFTSPDASFNTVPGAIVRVFLPTRASIAPGTEYTVRVDRRRTVLLDTQGQEIPIELENDRLEFE